MKKGSIRAPGAPASFAAAALAVCALSALGVLAVRARASTPPPAAEARPPATVLAERLKPTELFDELSYPARVLSRVNTVIRADVDGTVTDIQSQLGRRVGARKRIFKIAQLDPRYAPVWAITPLAGVISSIDVSLGSQVARGQSLATLTDPSRLRIMVEVPAMDLPVFANGSPTGEFRLTERSESVAVRVRGVSPAVDPATGTAQAELEAVPGGTFALTPGMIGQVTFRANPRKGVVVPEVAILYEGDSPFVRLVDQGKTNRVKVALGRRSRGNVEITRGLENGGQVVVRSSRFVSDGEAVKVEEQPAEAAQ
jgi:membrane fusion protein (multidrug efflux system)